ncbi:MAG: hypothetical protein QE271_09945 [Bacteriovoracaceae bacterium]|nr:hypothetical protein [Bacteriovoracaceae bacterium]
MKYFWGSALFFVFSTAFAAEFELRSYMEEKKFFSRTNFEYLKDRKIISSSEVTDPAPKIQTLTHYVSGIHEKNCADSSAILGKYEDYKKHISFLDKSDYDGKTITMVLNAQQIIPLLPEKYFKFNINVEIERLKGAGAYKYTMALGIFKGLNGFVNVVETKEKKCLYYINADWKGEDTGMKNFIVKNLTEMISKRGLEKLFTISGSQPK